MIKHGGDRIITVSNISEYIYCPLKLYLKHNHEKDVQKHDIIAGKFVHEIRRDFEELLKRNIWSVKEDMEFSKIFALLYEAVPEIIEKKSQRYEDMESIDLNDIENLCEDIKYDLKLDSYSLAAQIKKILIKTGKTGGEISEVLFPPSLVEFSIDNQELNLSGKVDRIEIIDGIYYPVEMKTGKPPASGVWESDALQITAYALLIEQEFNRDVLVGFVDYLQINQRRPVVVNSNLREKLLDVLEEVYSMFYEGNIPEIKQNVKKCKICEYADLCEYCND